MKKIVWLSVLINVFLMGCKSNDPEVPPEVEGAFHQEYPDATEVEWIEKAKGLEVNFKIERSYIEVEYNKLGEKVEEETVIDYEELPEPIKNYLKKHYPQLHIGEASIEQEKGKKVYEIELLNGFFREMDLEFDIEGNLLNKESIKKE